MMVTDIIAAKRQTEFGARLKAKILERFPSMGAFQAQAYGRDQNGKPMGAGVIYPIIQGERAINRVQLEEILLALNLDDEEQAQLVGDMPIREKAVRKDRGIPRKVSKAKVRSYAPDTRPAPAQPAPADQLQFSVDGAGRAHIKLELHGVPLERALTLLAALASAKVLAGQPETLHADHPDRPD